MEIKKFKGLWKFTCWA